MCRCGYHKEKVRFYIKEMSLVHCIHKSLVLLLDLLLLPRAPSTAASHSSTTVTQPEVESNSHTCTIHNTVHIY